MADELTIHKNPWQRLRQYVADVRTEMKRVTWPSKQEIYGTTPFEPINEEQAE